MRRFVATIMYEGFFCVRVCISSFGMFIFCCAQCFSTMFNSIDLRVSSFYGDGIWLCFSFFSAVMQIITQTCVRFIYCRFVVDLCFKRGRLNIAKH